MEHELFEEYYQNIEQALAEGDENRLADLLSEPHPAQLAQTLESLPPERRERLWTLMKRSAVSEVLAYLPEAIRLDLLEDMPAAEVAEVARQLDIDDAVDLLQDLPEAQVEAVLQSLDDQHRARLDQVLRYPEDTAGGLMNTDVLTVREEVSLEVVLRYLRRHPSLPEKTDMLPVIDRNQYFQGILRLEDLLVNQPETLVADVMTIDINPIPATTPAQIVANLFAQRDWVSAPVVDDNGLLLGRITIDDVVDVIRGEAEHAVMGGAGLDEEDDMFAPVLQTVKSRAFWLGINLATAFLAAWVIGWFENALEQVVALAVLMPIVASMGGIAGTQTLTIMIRGMALGKVSKSNRLVLLRKELITGMINGLLWAFVVGILAYLWFGNLLLGLIIAVAITTNLLFAALAGALIPLALKRLSIDPALAGGVVLTTVTDVVGFFAFLGLATIFLLS